MKSKKGWLRKFLKRTPWYFTIPIIIVVSLAIIALAAFIVWAFAETKAIWTSVLVVFGLFMLSFHDKIEQFISSKAESHKRYLDSRRDIVVQYFKSFFSEHDKLPIEIERVSGSGEYLQRLSQYEYGSLTVFVMSLADMGTGEYASEKAMNIFERQLQQYVDDFLLTCQYNLPTFQDTPPIIFLEVDYSEEDYCFVIRFTFCESRENYQDALAYKAKLANKREKRK